MKSVSFFQFRLGKRSMISLCIKTNLQTPISTQPLMATGTLVNNVGLNRLGFLAEAAFARTKSIFQPKNGSITL